LPNCLENDHYSPENHTRFIPIGRSLKQNTLFSSSPLIPDPQNQTIIIYGKKPWTLSTGEAKGISLLFLTPKSKAKA
jgi:hypothetical protein